MSLELHVFIQDAEIPTRDSWQHAIEEAGFPTILEPTLDLRHDTGFRPPTYNDQATGYEIYLEVAAGLLEVYPDMAEQVGPRDMCVTFRWGGDLLEYAAAISSAAALTKLTDGIYFFPDDGIFRTAVNVIKETRDELAPI